MKVEGAYEAMGGFRLNERELDRLLAGRAPDGAPELERVALFVRALPTAFSADPGPADPGLIAALAEVARSESDPAAQAPNGSPGRRRPPRRRLALFARVGVAAATVPALLAGMAVAGVNLPDPASDAFDRLGLELPNQALDGSEGSGEAKDAGRPASGKAGSGKGSSSSSKQGSGGSGKGAANRRTRRQANGPSQSAQADPPGNARRRGPNPSPGVPPAKPDWAPSTEKPSGQPDGQSLPGQGQGQGPAGGRNTAAPDA